MAQEQLPATFMEEFRALKREVAALRKATPLNNASLSGVVTVLDGRVESDDYEAGEAGWSLQPDVAEFNNILLRGGIIGNDALANPVQAGMVSWAETGWGTSTTDEDRAESSIPIPDGFTQALVLLTVTAGAVNNTPNSDYLYLQAVVDGAESREQPVLTGGNNGWANVTTAKASILTGLTGAAIPVSARIHTQEAAWAADAVNRAYVEGIAIFLR